MLKKLAVVLVVLLVAVAGFLAFVASRPGSFRVERTTSVAALPERIYPLVADLRRMDEWSPWDELDPSMKKQFSGDPAQPGAGYSWAGNDQVGEGKMTILEVSPPTRVTFRLEFLKPHQSVATTGFQLVPDGSATKVSWNMEGKLSFMEKLVGVFMDMEGMIAKDFDAGLAGIKAIAERPEPAPAAAPPAPTPG